MNLANPKIKLIVLILISPLFSFLNGNNDISDLSEMGYLWGFPADLASNCEDTESSEKDFSVYQLSFHAVNLASNPTENLVNQFTDIKPLFPTAVAHLSELSKAVFLTAHHFSSSYLQGHNQRYTLARHLLWEVFLI